jgi:hypothetical protein
MSCFKISVYVGIFTSLLLYIVIFVSSSYPVLGCSSVFWVPSCVVLFFRLLFLGGVSCSFCGLLSSLGPKHVVS